MIKIKISEIFSCIEEVFFVIYLEQFKRVDQQINGVMLFLVVLFLQMVINVIVDIFSLIYRLFFFKESLVGIELVFIVYFQQFVDLK